MMSGAREDVNEEQAHSASGPNAAIWVGK
jgi:hypothetical protein